MNTQDQLDIPKYSGTILSRNILVYVSKKAKYSLDVQTMKRKSSLQCRFLI